MNGTTRQNTWQAVVGFFLGGFAAQLFGTACIALALNAHGQFSLVHFLNLSFGERQFLMAIPVLLAVPFLRRRPYVSVGMLLYSAFLWMTTAPRH
jgi:hypothetical protein